MVFTLKSALTFSVFCPHLNDDITLHFFRENKEMKAAQARTSVENAKDVQASHTFTFIPNHPL